MMNKIKYYHCHHNNYGDYLLAAKGMLNILSHPPMCTQPPYMYAHAPSPSTIKLSIMKRRGGVGLAGQTKSHTV